MKKCVVVYKRKKNHWLFEVVVLYCFYSFSHWSCVFFCYFTQFSDVCVCVLLLLSVCGSTLCGRLVYVYVFTSLSRFHFLLQKQKQKRHTNLQKSYECMWINIHLVGAERVLYEHEWHIVWHLSNANVCQRRVVDVEKGCVHVDGTQCVSNDCIRVSININTLIYVQH